MSLHPSIACLQPESSHQTQHLYYGLRAVKLRAVFQDPLLAAGGLRRMSEMGRLLLESTLLVDDADSDDNSVQGDSDDGDFAQEAMVDDSDDEDPMDLAHGVGLQMGAHLAHVPIHELLGGHLGGIDDDGEYPHIYD